jgi:transcriptional regulator with XRE-family HTH domain
MRKQSDLAERSGVSVRTISLVENGQRVPNPVTLRKLELALEWAPGSVDAILNGGRATELTAAAGPAAQQSGTEGLTDLERAIYDDPDLDADAKDLMLRTLRRVRERSVGEGQRSEKRIG